MEKFTTLLLTSDVKMNRKVSEAGWGWAVGRSLSLEMYITPVVSGWLNNT